MANPEHGARSNAIREYLKSNPAAGPNQVVAALKEQGINVTKGLVSNIKYGGQSSKKKGKSGRRASAAIGHKRRGAATLSETVREFLRSHPGAMPKAIKEGLKAQGVKVSTSLISFVKYGRPAKKASPSLRVAARKTTSRNVDLTAQQLIQVKRLSDSLGGAARVRQALEALEELQ